MLDVIIQVAADPVLVECGPCRLNAVETWTPVSKRQPLLSLWLYDAAHVRIPPVAAPYARALNGRQRKLGTGLAVPYKHGLVAVVVPDGWHTPRLAEVPSLSFTLFITPTSDESEYEGPWDDWGCPIPRWEGDRWVPPSLTR